MPDLPNSLWRKLRRNPKLLLSICLTLFLYNQVIYPQSSLVLKKLHFQQQQLNLPLHSQTLSAYIEPRFGYYKTNDPPEKPVEDNFYNPEPLGDLIVPLKLRTQSPSELRRIQYPKVTSCSDLPHNLPVDPGLTQRPDGELLLKNVNNDRITYPDLLEELLPHTPVDSDPFLPWIHDVFTSRDGTLVNFVAHNKRRCNNGKESYKDFWNLEPQAALLEPVAVKRTRANISEELWTDGVEEEERYQLTTHDDADEDGKETRFLCRFHSRNYINVTLSIYSFNYEYIHYWRKGGYRSMLSSSGTNDPFWLSTLKFSCPVPAELQEIVVSGQIEGRVYLDLIPIRTPPRYNQIYIKDNKEHNDFNASMHWEGHVLPKMEASGRWANLPVCKPPPPTTLTASEVLTPHDAAAPNQTPNMTKPHYLVGCLWASSTYTTRHDEVHSDTLERLTEWLEFHFLVGFDHFYLYDNSAANNQTGNDLSSMVDLFGSDKITRIPWPFRVCNNNKYYIEWSSQYAAESSCIGRYGDSTEWMAGFDLDEYLVPMGDYRNLKDWLKSVDSKEPQTNILSFRSTEAMLRYDLSIPFEDDRSCKANPSMKSSDLMHCRAKDPDRTILQSYNCESHPYPGPRPDWSTRARKQIYRPEYVLGHFVHYTTITKGMLSGNGRYSEKTEQYTKEMEEAIMIHAKTGTKGWNEKQLGFPWPGNKVGAVNKTKEGWLYNCWINERVEDVWVPKLVEAMEKRKNKGSD